MQCGSGRSRSTVAAPPSRPLLLPQPLRQLREALRAGTVLGAPGALRSRSQTSPRVAQHTLAQLDRLWAAPMLRRCRRVSGRWYSRDYDLGKRMPSRVAGSGAWTHVRAVPTAPHEGDRPKRTEIADECPASSGIDAEWVEATHRGGSTSKSNAEMIGPGQLASAAFARLNISRAVT